MGVVLLWIVLYSANNNIEKQAFLPTKSGRAPSLCMRKAMKNLGKIYGESTTGRILEVYSAAVNCSVVITFEQAKEWIDELDVIVAEFFVENPHAIKNLEQLE